MNVTTVYMFSDDVRSCVKFIVTDMAYVLKSSYLALRSSSSMKVEHIFIFEDLN